MENSNLRNTLIYSVLVILVLGAAVFMWMYPAKTPTLGVVDMRMLIAQRAEDLAKTIPVGTKVRSHQIRELTDQLRDDLQLFAQENGVVLLNKGTVAGGELPDYTDAALGVYKVGERS